MGAASTKLLFDSDDSVQHLPTVSTRRRGDVAAHTVETRILWRFVDQKKSEIEEEKKAHADERLAHQETRKKLQALQVQLQACWTDGSTAVQCPSVQTVPEPEGEWMDMVDAGDKTTPMVYTSTVNDAEESSANRERVADVFEGIPWERHCNHRNDYCTIRLGEHGASRTPIMLGEEYVSPPDGSEKEQEHAPFHAPSASQHGVLQSRHQALDVGEPLKMESYPGVAVTHPEDVKNSDHTCFLDHVVSPLEDLQAGIVVTAQQDGSIRNTCHAQNATLVEMPTEIIETRSTSDRICHTHLHDVNAANLDLLHRTAVAEAEQDALRKRVAVLEGKLQIADEKLCACEADKKNYHREIEVLQGANKSCRSLAATMESERNLFRTQLVEMKAHFQSCTERANRAEHGRERLLELLAELESKNSCESGIAKALTAELAQKTREVDQLTKSQQQLSAQVAIAESDRDMKQALAIEFEARVTQYIEEVGMLKSQNSGFLQQLAISEASFKTQAERTAEVVADRDNIRVQSIEHQATAAEMAERLEILQVEAQHQHARIAELESCYNQQTGQHAKLSSELANARRDLTEQQRLHIELGARADEAECSRNAFRTMVGQLETDRVEREAALESLQSKLRAQVADLKSMSQHGSDQLRAAKAEAERQRQRVNELEGQLRDQEAMLADFKSVLDSVSTHGDGMLQENPAARLRLCFSVLEKKLKELAELQSFHQDLKSEAAKVAREKHVYLTRVAEVEREKVSAECECDRIRLQAIDFKTELVETSDQLRTAQVEVEPQRCHVAEMEETALCPGDVAEALRQMHREQMESLETDNANISEQLADLRRLYQEQVSRAAEAELLRDKHLARAEALEAEKEDHELQLEEMDDLISEQKACMEKLVAAEQRLQEYEQECEDRLLIVEVENPLSGQRLLQLQRADSFECTSAEATR